MKVTKSFFTTYTESGMYTEFVLSVLILSTLMITLLAGCHATLKRGLLKRVKNENYLIKHTCKKMARIPTLRIA